MAKDSFIFYRSFYEAIIELDEHSRWLIIDAICRKALYGEDTQFTGLLKMVFTLISPILEANLKKSEAGIKGGRPKKTIGYENTENSKTIGYEIKKPIPSNDVDVEEEEDIDEDKDFDFKKEKIEKIDAANAATHIVENNSVLSDPNEKLKEKEKSSAKKENETTIEERAAEFWAKLQSYKETYSCEMLQAFCAYWTEHNVGGRKMRFEMEKIFDIKRRLATWATNEQRFNHKSTTKAPTASSNQSVNNIWQ